MNYDTNDVDEDKARIWPASERNQPAPVSDTEVMEYLFNDVRLKAQPATTGAHWSDCAVHNEPAMPAGPCDCDANAPVSATEPEQAPRMSQAMWDEFFRADTGMVDGDAMAHVITTLRARLAEAERVTEEQVEQALSAWYIARSEFKTVQASMRAALTAARGGG